MPGADISVRFLDLADPVPIEDFTTWHMSEYSTLDTLVNNAGTMTPPYGAEGLMEFDGVAVPVRPHGKRGAPNRPLGLGSFRRT